LNPRKKLLRFSSFEIFAGRRIGEWPLPNRVRCLTLAFPGISKDGFHISAKAVMNGPTDLVDFFNNQTIRQFVNHFPPSPEVCKSQALETPIASKTCLILR